MTNALSLSQPDLLSWAIVLIDANTPRTVSKSLLESVKTEIRPHPSPVSETLVIITAQHLMVWREQAN